MSPETIAIQSWLLEPRDPVVFGDGARVPALAPRHRFLLPPQGTFAGMVRTRFVAGQADVSREDARGLLAIRLRGPWLARSRSAGQTPELWLPIPADVMAVRHEDGESYLAGKLLLAGPGEGALWPGGTSALPMLVQNVERLEGGTKTSRPKFPFWPFDEVVQWNLDPRSLSSVKKRDHRPIRPEYRVHVAIEDTTWTAEPEALFSSAGLRYDAGFGLVAEVIDGRGLPVAAGPSPGSPPQLLVLGAEARTVSCIVLAGSCFPSFDIPAHGKTYREIYRRRIAQLLEEGHRIGLRLQLLTSGCFGGWQPQWPEEFRDKLLGVCLDRYIPASGWDLQKKGPRSVRRLVPAGSVYYLGPFDRPTPEETIEQILNLCSVWWGKSLCEGQKGDEESFLAPPSHDGYGLVLPAPFGLPRSLKP